MRRKHFVCLFLAGLTAALAASGCGKSGSVTAPSEAVESVPQLRFLLREQPALLSVMFLILLALEPFMMGFGGFNQLSGDIANRGLRYLLLRTGRRPISTNAGDDRCNASAARARSLR